MSTSGHPRRKAKSSLPFHVTMTPEERKANSEFARDPERVKRSARAFLKLVEEGKIDVW